MVSKALVKFLLSASIAGSFVAPFAGATEAKDAFFEAFVRTLTPATTSEAKDGTAVAPATGDNGLDYSTATLESLQELWDNHCAIAGITDDEDPEGKKRVKLPAFTARSISLPTAGGDSWAPNPGSYGEGDFYLCDWRTAGCGGFYQAYIVVGGGVLRAKSQVLAPQPGLRASLPAPKEGLPEGDATDAAGATDASASSSSTKNSAKVSETSGNSGAMSGNEEKLEALAAPLAAMAAEAGVYREALMPASALLLDEPSPIIFNTPTDAPVGLTQADVGRRVIINDGAVGTLYITDGDSFSFNALFGMTDGAVVVNGSGTLNLNGNFAFQNHMSETGSAIYASGSVTLGGNSTDLTFYGNYSGSSAGGAIYAGSDINLTGNYKSITVNLNTNGYTANGRGGAFYAGGNINITNTSASGGSLSITENGSAGNTLNSGSGAFYAGNNIVISGNYTDIVIQNNSMTDNSSGNAGGGAFYAGNSITINTQTTGDLTVSDNQSALDGGAFYTDTGSVTVAGQYNNISIKNNAAGHNNGSGDGGAIAGHGVNLLADTGGQLAISDNTAAGNGGAIASVGAVTVSGTHGNVMISGNRSGIGGSGDGGAFYATQDITINPTGAGGLNILRNTASSDGGALHSEGSVRLGNLNGHIEIQGNTALDAGGAFYADTDINITAAAGANGVINAVGNSASTGGAFHAGRSVKIDTGANSNLMLNISGNTADSGGAIFADNGDITVSGSYGEIAIRNNKVDSGATPGLTGGAFSAFRGNVVFDTDTGGSLWIAENQILATSEWESARAYGGAIYGANGIRIAGNYSDINIVNNGTDAGQSYGGAFSAGGDIHLSGSAGMLNITGNTTNLNNAAASNSYASGGAFYSEKNIILDGQYSLIDICNNTAGAAGGAFYAGTGLTIDALQSNEVVIKNNKVENGSGGAFYTKGDFNFKLGTAATMTATGNSAGDTLGSGGFLAVGGDMTFDIGTGSVATIGHAGNHYDDTISQISGTSGSTLAKTGSGALNLFGWNTYEGNSRISAGTIGIGFDRALSDTHVTFENNTTLRAVGDNVHYSNDTTLNGGVTVDVSNADQRFYFKSALDGNGTLYKTGDGTMVLTGHTSGTAGGDESKFISGNNAIKVARGFVEIDDAIAQRGALSLESGAVAYGAGAYGGEIRVNSGGKLIVSPDQFAHNIGTLFVAGNVTLASGANIVFNLGDGTGVSYSQIAMAGGSVTALAGAEMTLDNTGYTGIMADRFDLFTGAIAGDSLTVTVNGAQLVANDASRRVNLGGRNYYLEAAGGTISLVGVPEPSTYALIAGAFACGLAALSRRRKAK